MSVHTITLGNALNGAKLMTSRVANLKDYKVRTNRLRLLRELARELMHSNGYIIASANELNERYGSLMAEPMTMQGGNGEKHVWGLDAFKPRYSDSPKVDIYFCACY